MGTPTTVQAAAVTAATRRLLPTGSPVPARSPKAVAKSTKALKSCQATTARVVVGRHRQKRLNQATSEVSGIRRLRRE